MNRYSIFLAKNRSHRSFDFSHIGRPTPPPFSLPLRHNHSPNPLSCCNYNKQPPRAQVFTFFLRMSHHPNHALAKSSLADRTVARGIVAATRPWTPPPSFRHHLSPSPSIILTPTPSVWRQQSRKRPPQSLVKLPARQKRPPARRRPGFLPGDVTRDPPASRDTVISSSRGSVDTPPAPLLPSRAHGSPREAIG